MTTCTRLTYYLAVCSVLLMGTLLLARGLDTSQRLHPDEAYFLTFARQASVMGDGLLSGALDKPPLVLYMQAVSQTAFAIDRDEAGVLHLDIYRGEWAGRMVGVYSALVAGAFLMSIARHMGGRWMSLGAGAFFLASPYVTAWGASAFLDMPMLALGLGAWLAMLKGRGGMAGVLWALAFASKTQALFLLPLIVLSGGMLSGTSRRIYNLFIMGALAGVGALLVWDGLRPETSIFALGAVNNIADDGLWGDVGAGVGVWWAFWAYLAGHGLLTGVVLVSGLWMGIKRGRWVWLAWLLAYALLHIVTRLNIYDRYLLLTLPLIALLMGYWAQGQAGRWALAVLVCGMGALAWQTHEMPIGGDRGDYAHIDQLAHDLNGLPVATVIYDTWLGWQMGYYMGEWSDKRRVHYPTPDALARGALALDEMEMRYFIAPDDAPYEAYIASLRVVGFGVERVAQWGRFLVFAVNPAP